MEITSSKNPNLFNNILVRILSFFVLVFLARFAYVITLNPKSFSDFSSDYSDTENSRVINYYSSVFQDLISDGFLSPHSKSLSLDTRTAGQHVVALIHIGVSESTAISNNPSQPFDDNTFDFEFSTSLDRSSEFASDVSRTLKPGGFLVIHTDSKDPYSLNSLLDLFNSCTLVRSREIDGLDSLSVRQVVLMKEENGGEKKNQSFNGNSGKTCSFPGYKRELIKNAEPLIIQEPLKPWIALKRNIKNVLYLSSMVDISFKNKYVYVDVGARSYGSSIGSWFKKIYPKQNKPFEIYAIEADKAFHEEYRSKKGVHLLPYAAWVRNETLFFEISREARGKSERKGRGMGRIQAGESSSSNFVGDLNKIEGFDFANWLKSVVSERDYVVVKMDVEGTEFHLIPRLVETGAICLIDEMFLECHYNRWQRCCPGVRSPKYHKTYAECLELFSSLRRSGVLVHQWW